MSGARSIEVRDDDRRCYMAARLRDIEKDKYQVQLGKDKKARKWVKWTQVHEASAPRPDYLARQGDMVEVRWSADEQADEPACWYDATVDSIKGEFFKVKFLGLNQQDVVEADRIRPVTVPPTRTKQPFVKQVYQLPVASLHSWFLQNEQTISTDISSKSNLISLIVHKKVPQIMLMGTERAIARSKMLLDLHGKHLGDIQRIHMEREQARAPRLGDRAQPPWGPQPSARAHPAPALPSQLASKLQSERAKMSTGYRIDFAIEKGLIGLVVGKGGRHIQAIATTAAARPCERPRARQRRGGPHLACRDLRRAGRAQRDGRRQDRSGRVAARATSHHHRAEPGGVRGGA